MSASYPHPIIAREGWPFLAATVVVAVASGWLIGWWSAPLLLSVLFALPIFRDPPPQAPRDAHTVGSTGGRPIMSVGPMLEPNLRRPLLNTEIRRRGIYLLPNLFTTAALFAGFYSIVMAMNQRFDNAAVAIFIAMILDTLDGRVARLTHTQSAFGAEYDSLSDMVCFGAAPALVIYEWALKDLGRVGWIAAFVYCAGAALRLARFNTNIAVIDKRFFQGLPSPAAAALVAGFLWLASDNKIPVDDYGPPLVAGFLTLYPGLTMVSNVPFYSFKDINLRRSVPFTVILLIVLGFILISTDPH